MRPDMTVREDAESSTVREGVRTDREGMASRTVRDEQILGATHEDATPGRPPQTAHETGAEDGSLPDRSTTARSLIRLPEALAARFQVEKELAPGNEADLLVVVRDRRTGEELVVKLYRLGRAPKPEILDRVATLDPRFVARQHEHGECDGRVYEIIEYAADGSLKNLGATPQPEQVLSLIIKQLSDALAYLHALSPPLVHRDLKPENVLLRRRDPPELVLTDFGIASIIDAGTRIVTLVKRTVRYAAPEAAAGDISPAADWWSLGMMVAEAAQGRHPFADVSEQAIDIHLNGRKPVPLQGIADARIRLLCQGLLSYDQASRWRAGEVQRWLKGDTTLRAPPQPAPASEARDVYKFPDRTCADRRELAAAMCAHWEDAKRDLTRLTMLHEWLVQHGEHNAARWLRDLGEQAEFRALDAGAKLSLFLPVLDPSLPPVVDGQSLTRPLLLELAVAAQNGRAAWPAVLQPGYGERLAELTKADWLTAAYAAWSEAVAAARTLDARVRRRAPHLVRLEPAGDLRLLVLALDTQARQDAAVACVRSLASPAAGACPWVAPLLRADANDPSVLWVLAARLADIERDGRPIAERRHAERAARFRRAMAVVAVLAAIGFWGVLKTGQMWQARAVAQAEAQKQQDRAAIVAALQPYVGAGVAAQTMNEWSCALAGNDVLFPVLSGSQHRSNMRAILGHAALPTPVMDDAAVQDVAAYVRRRVDALRPQGATQPEPGSFADRLMRVHVGAMLQQPRTADAPAGYDPVRLNAGLTPQQKERQCALVGQLDLNSLAQDVARERVP